MMAKENDEVQHNNNNSCSSRNSNNNGVDSLNTSVGVTSTSNATEIPTAVSYCEADVMVGDIARTGDKSKVTSAGGGDCAGTTSRSNHFGASTSSFMRGKLNDLVADLCINGPVDGSDSNGGYGDYTNGRSNSSAPVDATMQQTNISSTWEPVSSSVTSQHVPQPHVAPTQNSSSFSFKHFLSSGPPITAPSSTVTVTSLDSTAANSTNGAQNNNTRSASSSGSASIQTSTGARPKVPQSASLSSTSISSLMTGGLSATNSAGPPDSANTFGTSATKMKRSPRFSSFDSQASLAEYVTGAADEELEGVSSTGPSGVRSSGVGANTNTGFRLYPEGGDIFSTPPRSGRGLGDGGAGISNSINNANEYERHQYVPRSYSNYEMPMSSSAASPRRRTGAPNVSVGGGMREARPTRLALNTNSSKPKGNLPLGDISSGACGGAAVAAAPPVTRPLPSNAGEFPAAILPDFVQDHWLDSWYAHDMHLNSPPNSPIRDFSDVDVAGGAIGGGGGAGGQGNVCDVAGGVSAGIGIPGPSPVYGGVGSCGGGGGGGATAESTASNVKMLPDFLSDGPIIHSSQRLADVAVGLPSNSMGSPDDPPISSQLSRLRIENDRLQRELNDARMALNEQTRRANDLERQLQASELQQQQNQQQHRIAELQATERVEELAARSKRTRTTAAAVGATSQNYVVKLKQQVAKLTSELETLRHENETLREEGAVGGFNVPYCDRSRPFVSDVSGGGAGAGAAAGVHGAVGRPSRTQQFSRDLLRAASNAENNLRQLLAGVDNLRQMAADIENTEVRVGYDASPDLFSDFVEDCDDYEDYSDGPTL